MNPRNRGGPSLKKRGPRLAIRKMREKNLFCFNYIVGTDGQVSRGVLKDAENLSRELKRLIW